MRLARHPECRIRGHLLEAVTAYVTRTEQDAAHGTGIRIAFACDMLDPDWPYLVVRELSVRPEDRLDAIVDSHFSRPRGDEDVPAMFRCTPLRELLRLVLNAILYATSADASREELPLASTSARQRSASHPPLTSEKVFHLPGTIDIGPLRELQRAVHGSSDRQQVHRCMVRGHWRRASKRYADPRPRWIAPHWRGRAIRPSRRSTWRSGPIATSSPARGARSRASRRARAEDLQSVESQRRTQELVRRYEAETVTRGSQALGPRSLWTT